jgi:hypothetical protein
VNLLVVVLSEFQNRVEVLTGPQRIEPRVAHERFVRIETSAHDVRQDFDGAIVVPSVREADQLVEKSLGIPEPEATSSRESLEALRNTKASWISWLFSDYSADAVLFTPNGPLKGHDPMREFFRALIEEFGQPGTAFSLQLQSIDGDFAYSLWSAETADNVYEMATDTQIVRGGKIVAQSFAGHIKPKR